MIVGILLAAGSARRFGSDKLLARLPDDRTVAGASAAAMVQALGQVMAVIRPGQLALGQVLAGAGCRVTRCPAAIDGMGASLACGVNAVADATGWVIALADMPAVSAATIARVGEMLEEDETAIAAPAYHGARGHPVGFGRAYGPALAALAGDCGARSLVQANHDRLRVFETEDPGVLLDVDTPSDLQRVGRAL
ncbi:nucleotidyltransferase family protein [Ectothiorhodospiraceae bacterium WFHF3C12]|nr:nucleotidyltransferase family protein [Ectothiorhodospiraceae bacterium WFHF3C12]